MAIPDYARTNFDTLVKAAKAVNDNGYQYR